MLPYLDLTTHEYPAPRSPPMENQEGPLDLSPHAAGDFAPSDKPHQDDPEPGPSKRVRTSSPVAPVGPVAPAPPAEEQKTKPPLQYQVKF